MMDYRRASALKAGCLLVIATLTLLFVGCAPTEEPVVEINGKTMGTSYNVKIVTTAKADSGELKDDIDHRLRGINAILSTYDPDSSLSRFNRSQNTGWQKAPYTLITVLETAQRISQLSAGAFDVTVGPLVNLWGFGPDGPSVATPSPESLSRVLESVGYRKLSVRSDPPSVKKSHPDLTVDLSAIAKGFAVDQLAALLESKGYERYLVEIGGEMRVRGKNARGKPWRLGIEKPDAERRQVQQAVEMTRGAIATSGDYRNFFEKGGRRYSHTIDPKTGSPVTHQVASVTVLADDCMTADGLATAFMALGAEAGYALAEKMNIAAFFIVRSEGGFEERETPAFTDFNRAESPT